MLISLAHRIAFLAVPKSGTTAIEAALKQHSDIVFKKHPKVKHISATGYQRYLLPYLASIGLGDIPTMAVMRDPCDCLKSWYFYRRRPETAAAKSTRHLGFDAFVEAHLATGTRPPLFARVGLQSRFLCGKGNEPLVDYLFPYERMQDVVDFLAARTGVPLALEKRNPSQREAVDLEPALMARLRRERQAEFDLHARVMDRAFYPPAA